MSEWIDWHGGVRPVSEDTVVEVRINGVRHNHTLPAREFDWAHGVGIGNIVAYRVVEPDVSDADVAELDQINSGHYLELMDRLHVIKCNLAEHIEQHPLTEKHADLRAMVHAAGSILADMYQRVGELDPD